jgi:hypothetical protein
MIDAASDITRVGKHYTNHSLSGGFALNISVPSPSDFRAWASDVNETFKASPQANGKSKVLQRYERWYGWRDDGWAGYYCDYYQQYYDRLQQLSASYDSVRVRQAAHGAKMATCVARMLNIVEEVRKIDQALYKGANLGAETDVPL